MAAGVISASLLVAGPLLGKQGVVRTRDGSQFAGDVIEDPQAGKVTVDDHGISTVIDSRNVAGIEYSRSPAADLNAKLAKLAPNDAAGRIALARQALEAKQYHIARDLLDSAQQIDPNNGDIAQLQQLVTKQEQLDTAVQGAASANGRPAVPLDSGTPSSPPTTGPAGAPGANKLLPAADIQRIKRAEWQRGDAAVRAQIRDNAQQKYVRERALDAAQFAQLSVADQAFAIKTDGSPKLQDDVIVLNDPAAMMEFKTRVQPRLLAGCAAAGCHNTARGGGDLVLFSPATSDAATYTNFFILQQYLHPVHGVAQPMINRIRPGQSLLLEYGLPPDQSEVRHPHVDNMRPIFTGPTDLGYLEISDWMVHSLSPVVPDYGIQYGVPTSQPAPTTMTTAAGATPTTQPR